MQSQRASEARSRLYRTAPTMLRRYDPARWEGLERALYADLRHLVALRDAGTITALAYDRYVREALALLHRVNWGDPPRVMRRAVAA